LSLDFNLITKKLMLEQERRAHHLAPMIRAIANDHFLKGIQAALRAVAAEAIAEEQQPVTAPLAVQPAHSAVSER